MHLLGQRSCTTESLQQLVQVDRNVNLLPALVAVELLELTLQVVLRTELACARFISHAPILRIFTMPTSHQAIFQALAEPFTTEIKHRPGKGGEVFEYITSRTVMNRLDDVLGPENWSDRFEARANSVTCWITIRLPDGTTLTKCDSGGYRDMKDEGDAEKSGFSQAFKRAAVKFGIGRHLYGDGVARFRSKPDQPVRITPTPQQTQPFQATCLPVDGAQLYRWASALGDRYQVNILGKIRELALAEGLDARYSDWSSDTVSRITWRVMRFCQRLRTYGGEFDSVEPPSAPDAAINHSEVERTRSALWDTAASLFASNWPGKSYDQQAIKEVIRDVSNGAIPDIEQCQDLRLLQATLEESQNLLGALRSQGVPT